MAGSGRIAFCGFLLLATATVAARAAEPALFGIAIGKPLTVPRCAQDPVITGKTDNLCWWNRDGSDQQVGELDLSMGPTVPSYFYSNLLVARLSKGVVSRVSIVTDGAEVQTVISNILKQKFGPPSTSHIRTLQNGFGARFSVLSQQWTFKNGADLRFEGTLDDVERGSIIMRAPAEVANDNAGAKRALGPPL